jgi:hypothetical protein
MGANVVRTTAAGVINGPLAPGLTRAAWRPGVGRRRAIGPQDHRTATVARLQGLWCTRLCALESDLGRLRGSSAVNPVVASPGTRTHLGRRGGRSVRPGSPGGGALPSSPSPGRPVGSGLGRADVDMACDNTAEGDTRARVVARVAAIAPRDDEVWIITVDESVTLYWMGTAP